MTETENVATYARIRPYNPAINEDKQLTARSDGNKVLNKNGKHEDAYNFTKAFGMEDNTETLFEEAMRPLLDYKILKGIDSIFMVYGQSGSGKSYTLIGEGGRKGLLPMSLEYLLTKTDQVETIYISGIEAYGKNANKIEFYDLVKQLKLKQKAPKTFNAYLCKGHQVSAKNAQKLQISHGNSFEIITQLQDVSHMAPTLKNPHSSRGHTVYFCCIQMNEMEDVYFIAADLAGSEGMSALGTKAEFMNGLELACQKGKLKLNKKQKDSFNQMYKTRQLEAGCINNGLTQLQKMFEQLIKKNIQNAKGTGLRKILSSFISLKSAYSILFTLSASQNNEKATKATLKFARRTQLVQVKTIKAKKKINKDAIIAELNMLISNLHDTMQKKNQTIEDLEKQMTEIKQNNELKSDNDKFKQSHHQIMRSAHLARQLTLAEEEESKWRVKDDDMLMLTQCDELTKTLSYAETEESKRSADGTSTGYHLNNVLMLQNLSDIELKYVFDQIDKDGSGNIDDKELQNALRSVGQDFTIQQIDTLIDEVDQDHNKELNFDEFKIMARKAWFVDAFERKLVMRIELMLSNFNEEDVDCLIVVKCKEKSMTWNHQNNVSIASLQQFISNRFDMYMFLLEYMDRHKNTMLINNDMDLNTAIKCAQDEKRNELEISVSEYSPPDLPLHRFTVNDICDILKNWVYNDINHKKFLLKTQEIFKQRKLYGKKVSYLSGEDVKCIVKDEMIHFMTVETLNIIFDFFENWKNQDLSMTTKSAEEIAYILYYYPLQRLIEKIDDEQIDGAEIIVRLFETGTDNIFKSETGWCDLEIEQIQLLFSRYNGFNKNQFIYNMNTVIKNNDEALTNQILNFIKLFIANDETIDIEIVNYSIKNNKNFNEMQSFSDKIVNMVDGLIVMENSNNFTDKLVKQIYSTIAKFFVCNDRIDEISLRDWSCNNCGNYNFSQYINGKMNHKLSICTLCGISRIDSIVLKIRNHDTFIMVNDVNESQGNNTQDNEQHDDIEKLIQDVINSHKIDLFCLNRNDEKPCSSILRLGKELIKYKRWLQAIGNNDIHNTVQADIKTFVDNHKFKDIFIQAANSIAKITQPQMNLLMKMLDDDNINNRFDIETFLKSNRKTFAIKISNCTNIKRVMGARLYSKIRDNLKREAQQKQFGKLLSDLNLNIIDKDYHHILKSHIHEGNKNSIKNVFRFFNIVVHYEDANIDNCVSLKREQIRTIDRNKNFEENKNNTHDNDNTINTLADKNIWTLKQIYHQTQLDLIHTYLVHSSWKHMIHRYANEQHHPDEDEMENEEEKTSDPDIIPNKDKYVSDVIQNKEFGYGVVHEYHQLKPKYSSLYDEMIQNNQYSIDEDTFVTILIKAIRKHEIALSNEYKDKLICKVYNRKYRMIRNQMIAIKHILSIIIYTDLSNFCTAFRSTYRRVNNETTDEEVTKRHRQLYYYARCLYEAVDFFGQEISPNDSVYHGLNALMQFEKFTAYFNQPLSTTPSFRIAQQFSQSTGIILRLKSGKSTAFEANSSKIPKYLSVNWLSCFPNEDEALFYGSYVVLQIADITEADSLKGHKKELKMFDKFQKAIQNQAVIWNEDRNGAMIDALKMLIQKQQNNVAYDEKEENSQYITEYGSNLFKFFCHHPNTTIVCIRNFQSLPKPLHDALFL
eukprot:229697_1